MNLWDKRAETFDKLDWVHDRGYMDALVKACALEPGHRVLDVGCGTGQVAQVIAPQVKEVVGIDISPEMIAKARTLVSQAIFTVADARDMGFLAWNRFDCVVARMVFHHILDGLKQAIGECHRVLKPGGRLVVAEGIAPHPSLHPWFAQMMALKEERVNLRPEDLLKMLGGFRMVTAYTIVQPGMSLRNWLEYGGVPEEAKAALWEMHESLDEEGRALYNMQQLDGDLVMDWTTCIAVATK